MAATLNGMRPQRRRGEIEGHRLGHSYWVTFDNAATVHLRRDKPLLSRMIFQPDFVLFRDLIGM